MSYRKRSILTITAVVAMAVGVYGMVSVAGTDAHGTVAVHYNAELPNTTHTRVTNYYRRYGAAADRIEPLNGPESTRRTLVQSWDASGKLIRYDGSVATEDGRVLERISLNGTQIVSEDLRTGKTQVVSTDIEALTVDALSARGESEASKKAAAVAERGRDVVLAAGILTVTADAKLPSISSSTGVIPTDGYTIPNVSDIDAVSAYSVAKIDEASGRTMDLSTYAVTAKGDRVLLERRTVEQDFVREGK